MAFLFIYLIFYLISSVSSRLSMKAICYCTTFHPSRISSHHQMLQADKPTAQQRPPVADRLDPVTSAAPAPPIRTSARSLSPPRLALFHFHRRPAFPAFGLRVRHLTLPYTSRYRSSGLQPGGCSRSGRYRHGCAPVVLSCRACVTGLDRHVRDA